MTEHQIHYEKKFYKDNQTGYWISTSKKKIRAHVWVWEQNHGKVPKNYHVHHKDHDKSNNNIENLTILTHSDHCRLHMTPERREWSSKHCDKIRPLTKIWHSSEEGHNWHLKHGILGWENRQPFEIKCVVCDKKVVTKTYHQQFCSNKCKSKNRRDSGMDDENRCCTKCGKEFKINKYSRTKYCSDTCRRGY